MPHLVGVLGHENAIRLAPARWIEKAELYFFRALRKECEVNSFAVPCGSQRIRPARPNYQPRMPCGCAYHERSGEALLEIGGASDFGADAVSVRHQAKIRSFCMSSARSGRSSAANITIRKPATRLYSSCCRNSRV